MIILIDNYDSFSYNLYQLIGEINPDIEVIRNDALTSEEIFEKNPDYIIVSPGPGRPDKAGICEDLILKTKNRAPLLGVCLGHQAICEAFGGKIGYAKELMHGKTSQITFDKDCKLFGGIEQNTRVARYHSLAAEKIPSCLKITAQTEDGEIMAVKHKDYEIYGLQFHPESILTDDGKRMLENFLKI